MNESSVLFNALDSLYGDLPYVGIPHYEAIVVVLLIIFGVSVLSMTLMAHDALKIPNWMFLVFFLLFLGSALPLAWVMDENEEMKKNRYVEILMQDQETLGHVQRLREEIRYFNDSRGRK